MSARQILAGVAVLFVALVCASASAHEMRPSVLILHEDTPGVFYILWKTPMVGDARLALTPEFGGTDNVHSKAETQVRKGAAIDEWMLTARSLRGQTVRIRGLEGTMTDTFVQVFFADGTEWSEQLTPRRPSATIGEVVVRPHLLTAESRADYSPYWGIAGWGVMCALAEVVRRARNRGRYLVVGTAYALGFLSCAFVFDSIDRVL